MTVPVLSVLPGDVVRLTTPHNPRLDGALATVTEPAEWGAHVETAAAATGKYRAAWVDMQFVARPDAPSPAAGGASQARDAGYTGDACGQCGSLRMRRNGACLLCDACGSTSGCS